MADMRDRLIELLCAGTLKTEICTTETHLECESCRGDCGYCTILADHLLANGVILPEWISVKDRLPEYKCRCLVVDAAGDIEMDEYDGEGKFILDRSGAIQHPSHWMPLPPLPREEAEKALREKEK